MAFIITDDFEPSHREVSGRKQLLVELEAYIKDSYKGKKTERWCVMFNEI